VGLRVVNGGVNDHIDGHARCLLLVKPTGPLYGYTSLGVNFFNGASAARNT
jgi:hypothetical protein